MTFLQGGYVFTPACWFFIGWCLCKNVYKKSTGYFTTKHGRRKKKNCFCWCVKRLITLRLHTNVHIVHILACVTVHADSGSLVLTNAIMNMSAQEIHKCDEQLHCRVEWLLHFLMRPMNCSLHNAHRRYGLLFLADTCWHLGWIKSWRCLTFEPSSPSSPTSSLLELPVCHWAREGCCLQPQGILFRSLSPPHRTINDLSLKMDPGNTRSYIFTM